MKCDAATDSIFVHSTTHNLIVDNCEGALRTSQKGTDKQDKSDSTTKYVHTFRYD